jgi:hypothetical protein
MTKKEQRVKCDVCGRKGQLSYCKEAADFFSHMMNVLSVPVLAIEDSKKNQTENYST